ncbi:DUF6233 domain-containing protein [Streptomyces rubiginosohelvolus]|uniref:DUF6233 domain-containing protein n=1 Tax=Streptomyces rubiginosohelvolus TaxID=67362 RepID=UPI0033E1DCD9
MGRARAPDWGLSEAGIGVPSTEVHRGDCWAQGRSLVAVSAERARAELADGAQPCGVCRPDRVLKGGDDVAGRQDGAPGEVAHTLAPGGEIGAA